MRETAVSACCCVRTERETGRGRAVLAKMERERPSGTVCELGDVRRGACLVYALLMVPIFLMGISSIYFPLKYLTELHWPVRGSFMATLEGPIICQPALYAAHAKISAKLVKIPLKRVRNHRDGFLGYKGLHAGTVGGLLSRRHFQWKSGRLLCSLRSSSDGNGSMPENFSENDAEFVNASVMEAGEGEGGCGGGRPRVISSWCSGGLAVGNLWLDVEDGSYDLGAMGPCEGAVEVKSGSDGFFIRMRSGRNLRCVHNSPQGGHLPDYAPHPAIVLKMEDGSDILLPIIVLEMPSVLLMAALRNVPIARPTIYQVVQDMIDKMGYECISYLNVFRYILFELLEEYMKLTLLSCTFPRQSLVHLLEFFYLTYNNRCANTNFHLCIQVGDKQDIISFDLRPSDAINMAVRCKVPIQVNRTLAYNDGLRMIGQVKHAAESSQSDGFLTTELDRPDGQPCTETKEFDFVRNMLIAAVEERYTDAAQWRDKLFKLRSKKGTEHD
ncbi:hypothetical protein M5K25_024047 [Dendrobium thyrsiflorum]|uniref:BFN domain-containing protein n=1 Tax=Dendrobium thyrsiflorum TaxID=117978 RepID=A0ABD0U0T1_DENTH